MTNVIILYLSTVLMGVFSLFCIVMPYEGNLQAILVLLMFLLVTIYSIINREKAVLLLLFLISFFTFLLGGNLAVMLFPLDKEFEISKTTNIALILSLYCLFLGHYLSLNKFSIKSKSFKWDTPFYNQIRSVSLSVFYVTIFFKFLQSLEGIYLLQTYSYANLELVSRLPQFVIRLSLSSYLSFFCYLCTYPTKKELKKPFVIFLLALVSSILMGERGELVYGLFTLLFYFISRDYIEKRRGRDRFITRRLWAILLISTPFLLVGLYLYAFIRSSNDIVSNGFFNDLVSFFAQQGFSVKLIDYVQEWKSSLPDTNTSYVFGIVYSYFTDLLGIQNNHNLSHLSYDALYGNNLGATLTYLIEPNYYYSGGGFGTQYIAELYVDFGIIGIMVYNLFLGIFLRYLSFDVSHSYWGRTYSMIIILGLFSIPRDFCLSWIIRLVSPLNLFVVSFIYIFSIFFYKKDTVKLNNTTHNEGTMDY